MSLPVAVCVCTNREPERVAAALRALGEQVPAGLLALVLNGLGADSAARHREATPDVALVEEPRPGLSHARNAALEWCPAPVIAYVDDDAIADPGWYAALARAWEEAPADVACIGGPIRPRFDAPPPAWLSPPIMPALTLLDLGPVARDLDPEWTTVYGANVSFRVEPLRAIGGFDPAFGHAGARIAFSEEDEAERALAARGLRVRYVPDAGVRHVIGSERLTRRSFVRRRFAYGRTLGVRRARGAGLAARQAATSAAGALVALGRRDQALVMERAVRAAENAGVLWARARPRRSRDA